jgi:hypothetical protein
MLYFLSVLFCVTILSSSLQSMDTIAKRSGKKNHKSHSDGTIKPVKQKNNFQSFSRKSNEQQEHILIIAARNRDHNTIKFYLANPYINPNIQDKSGNTALHIVALFKHVQLIDIFFNNPRIDSSIRNEQNKTARECISGKEEEDYSLRAKFFARISLDMIVEREATNILPDYASGIITNDHLDATIKTVKYSMSVDKEKQIDDQALPDEVGLPLYADDTFIMNMLLFRLANKINLPY